MMDKITKTPPDKPSYELETQKLFIKSIPPPIVQRTKRSELKRISKLSTLSLSSEYKPAFWWSFKLMSFWKDEGTTLKEF